MHALPAKLHRCLEWVRAHLHYSGFVLLALMMAQALMATDRSERVFQESVRQQEELRNILWVNLLTQRATVLALSPRVTGDTAAYSRAMGIAESIPNYIPHSPHLKEVNSVLEQIRAMPGAAAERRLLSRVDALGTQLNAEESRQWYDLIAKNDGILHGQRRLLEGYFAYALIYLLFFAWVTTRRHRAEVSLKRSEMAQKAAEDANRAKSMFLANMSHELRTPMHGILSFARFGLRDARKQAPGESLAEHFQEIFDSGERLMSLLNDLLDLAKLEAGKMDYSFHDADLAEVCSHVIAEMHAFAEERTLRLGLALPDEQPLLGILDSTRMTQVVRNVLSNAIKFAEPGTEITVELSRTGQGLRCSIANRGKGIPAAELESIFDKFVQSSKTRTGAGGTGLGLAICREIVAAHRGRIWAESPPGGLTRFTIDLPSQDTKEGVCA